MTKAPTLVVIAAVSFATVRLTLLPAPVPAAVVASRFNVTPLKASLTVLLALVYADSGTAAVLTPPPAWVGGVVYTSAHTYAPAYLSAAVLAVLASVMVIAIRDVPRQSLQPVAA